LRGKFVMLDFWATWCGPCVREIPNLKKLHEAFSQSELIIVGLAHDNPMDLDDFVKENSIPYFTAISDPAIEKAYGIVAWPTTFLIDPSGKIIGKNLRGENLVDLIEHKLTQYKSQ